MNQPILDTEEIEAQAQRHAYMAVRANAILTRAKEIELHPEDLDPSLIAPSGDLYSKRLDLLIECFQQLNDSLQTIVNIVQSGVRLHDSSFPIGDSAGSSNPIGEEPRQHGNEVAK